MDGTNCWVVKEPAIARVKDAIAAGAITRTYPTNNICATKLKLIEN
ncbi:hypothetical protein [Nostoc sp. FACHB-892]|nr:hypothetical protein [Nostoc sp. FACHB-892]